VYDSEKGEMRFILHLPFQTTTYGMQAMGQDRTYYHNGSK